MLEEQINLGGILLNVTDTAGIRKTDDIVEKIGVEKAKKYVDGADLIIYVVDTSTELDENDYEIMKLLGNRPSVILMNKSDLKALTTPEDIKKYVDRQIIPVSVKERTGIEELERVIKEMFFDGEVTCNDEIYITNIRHKTALQETLHSLNLVIKSIYFFILILL